MAYLTLYLCAAAFFLVIDAIALRVVLAPLFERHIGDLMSEKVRLAPAAGFYACYVAGILYFCTCPALREPNLALAMMNGAILGFLAYGTYEATNLATLKGWTWSMAVIDVTWGVVLTASTATVAYLIGGKLGLG